jgi:hypothetical protein
VWRLKQNHWRVYKVRPTRPGPAQFLLVWLFSPHLFVKFEIHQKWSRFIDEKIRKCIFHMLDQMFPYFSAVQQFTETKNGLIQKFCTLKMPLSRTNPTASTPNEVQSIVNNAGSSIKNITVLYCMYHITAPFAFGYCRKQITLYLINVQIKRCTYYNNLLLLITFNVTEIWTDMSWCVAAVMQ